MTGAALVLAALLAQVATPGTPAPPPGGAQPNPTGTAVVKGRITAADTGRPLRRARVTLSGSPLMTPRSTSTNVRGEYELKDLPAGRFQLSVQRSGYLPVQFGQRRSTEPAKPLDVADGQSIDKMDFALPRTGIISGRIVDETGEPVAGVSMWIMRQEYFRGRRRSAPAGPTTTTDDLGYYRILNVHPGEYLVLAMLRETWLAGPERQPFGYAPTLFPGTPRAGDATRLKVGRGQEIPNTDFALVPTRAAVLSGIATSADGTPLAGARVTLSFELMGASGGISMGVTSSPVAADGSWRMRDISAGEYQLEVSASEPDRPPARAHATIQVQGADIDGISLVADSPGTITGHVVTDTGEALPAGQSRMRVIAESVAPDQRAFGILMGDDNGLVSTDGRFTFTGATGRSAVRVQSLPRGWVIRSIDAGDRDYAELPIDLRGGQKLDVRIVITSRFPQVSGRIVDTRGNQAEGIVLMFPEDSAKWFDTGVLRMTRPDQGGVFRMDSVRPGDYLAVALESVESWQVNDPEFLEELRSRATRVTVRDGQPELLRLIVR